MRPVTLLFWLACLIGLSVSATFLIGHTINEKQSNDKDRQILAIQKNNKLLSDKSIELQNSLQNLEDKYSNLESRYKDLAASLERVQHAAAVNANSSPSAPPPVEQPLVREGEFAVELATAFNLTSSRDEAAAESYLASINIMPGNGWIADYPMTPDIVAEVRESVALSASSGYLLMLETDAVDLLDNVSIAMNLPVRAGYESNPEYQSESAASHPETSEYVETPVVDDYYDDNKPPVVTYYPPPSEYIYLYSWVPSPFWWKGFRFRGFFILVDFDRHHHHHHVTNHVTSANGMASRINATTRARANTPNTAATSISQNPTSSNSALGTETVRDLGSTAQGIERLTSSPRARVDAASRTPSHDRATLNGAPSPRSSPGGKYRRGSNRGLEGGTSMTGFHGNSLDGGGQHSEISQQSTLPKQRQLSRPKSAVPSR